MKREVALQKHIILPYSDPKDNYGRESEGFLLRSGNLSYHETMWAFTAKLKVKG